MIHKTNHTLQAYEVKIVIMALLISNLLFTFYLMVMVLDGTKLMEVRRITR
jgi:hypothetical protein